MSRKDLNDGSGRKMVSILPRILKKSPVKPENENIPTQTVSVRTVVNDNAGSSCPEVKKFPASHCDSTVPVKITPHLQKGQLQKTILEAFIKVVGCRKLTVQTLSLDGKVLHSDVEEIEEEPEIINISKQEKVNETVSKFLVKTPEQYELKDTLLGKTNFTTTMSIKCPTFSGKSSSSSTSKSTSIVGGKKEKIPGQEALEVLETMIQFAMKKKSNTPTKANDSVTEKRKEQTKSSPSSSATLKKSDDLKTVESKCTTGHQTGSSPAENFVVTMKRNEVPGQALHNPAQNAHEADDSKKRDDLKNGENKTVVDEVEKMELHFPRKTRSKKSMTDSMNMAGDKIDDSLVLKENSIDMRHILDGGGDQISDKTQTDDSILAEPMSSEVKSLKKPVSELQVHVNKPSKRGRPRKVTIAVKTPEKHAETGSKRLRKPSWKCLEMRNMKEIDYPTKMRIAKGSGSDKNKVVSSVIKEEPMECTVGQPTMSNRRTTRNSHEDKHGSDEALPAVDDLSEIDAFDELNAIDGQDASDEFDIGDDFDFSIFDDDVYEKKYGGNKETVILSCPYCPKKYDKKPAYRKHVRKHKKELNIKKDVCDVCKKEFDNEYAFKAHVVTHKDQTENGRFKCSNCEKDYSSRGGLLKHLRSDKKCKIETYKCEYCFNLFANNESLEIHMRKHSKAPPERIYVCPKCDKSFETAGGLNKHKRSKACEISLKCDHCPKVFSNQVLFQKHCKTHNRVSTEGAICEECGKKFSSALALKSHQNTHAKVRNFKCEVCEKAFYLKGTLVSHMRIHTGERPYLCVYCGAGFRYNCHLKMHTRIHTGEKPHNCTECERSFQTKQSLKKHLLSHERIRQKNMSKLETMNIEVKQEYIDITDVNGATEEIVFVNAMDGEGDETTTQYIYTTEDGQHIQGYLANGDTHMQYDDAQQVVFQTMEGENVTVETSDLNILAETAESYDSSNVTYVIVKK